MAGDAFDSTSKNYGFNRNSGKNNQSNFMQYAYSADSGSTSNNSNTEITNELTQENDQEANSSNQFGNVSNVGNNNQISDYGSLFINNQQYGGNNRSFNLSYQGGADTQYKATPMSDLTMGGAFAVEDSPADTAKFMNKYSDLNETNQQQYKSNALTSVAKYMALGRDNKTIDPKAMDQRVQENPLYHLNMSRVEGAHTFGDQYSKDPADWKPIQPKDEDIGVDEDLRDEIFG